MSIKLFSLANILTLINAFFGCCAIVFLFSANYQYAIYCTIFCLIADFFDGFAARKYGNHSELGKQLDSLADAISFGVVPGVIVFMLLNGNNSLVGENLFTSYGLLFDVIKFAAFLIPLFSILRLVKFNIDTRQSEQFIGLATPANTLFWIGYMMIHEKHLFPYSGNIFLVLGLIILSSFLLISEIPMFSFKFKHYGFKGNEIRYLFLIFSIVLFLIFKEVACTFVVAVYVLVSIIDNIFFKKNLNLE